VERTFRDGHTETWWAADARAGSYRIYGPTRLVVATADPAALPERNTWYLATDFARPDLPAETRPVPAPPSTQATRQRPVLCWTVALRRVRSWLAPLNMLLRILRGMQLHFHRPRRSKSWSGMLKAGQGSIFTHPHKTNH
jgi:hypothetical protein